MKYTGIPCAACGKKFTAEDDVVVCPECGTPYHRACYKELGHCVNEARHAEGYVWQPPKAAPGPSVPLEEQPHAPQNKTDGEGYVMCSRCGTVNPAGQERCDLCGYPLKETGERIPAGDRETEDGGTFAEYVRDQYNVNPNEKLGDELTAREVAAYVGPNALNFLYKFRAMLQRKTAVSFNLGAFLFTGLYCFYRKMYALGGILLAIKAACYIPFAINYIPYFQEQMAAGATTLSEFMHINTLSPYYQALVSTSAIVQYGGLVLSVLCSLFFNYFYLKKITQQVRIQRYRGHAAAGTQQYYQNLSRMGGTSWLLVFLIVIGLLSVSSVVTSLFMI